MWILRGNPVEKQFSYLEKKRVVEACSNKQLVSGLDFVQPLNNQSPFFVKWKILAFLCKTREIFVFKKRITTHKLNHRFFSRFQRLILTIYLYCALFEVRSCCSMDVWECVFGIKMVFASCFSNFWCCYC